MNDIWVMQIADAMRELVKVQREIEQDLRVLIEAVGERKDGE